MNVQIDRSLTTATVPPAALAISEIHYPESDGKPMAETQVHIRVIAELLQILTAYFETQADVNVFADIMFYYEQGNIRRFVAPDVMVVKGIDKQPRRTFKLWEERAPEVVFEISSRATWSDDLNKKFRLYERIGVQEYYVFDPQYDYLPEPLVAYRRNDEGELEKFVVENNRVYSPALGLEIVDTRETLRLFDPQRQIFLLNLAEAKADLAEAETERARLEQTAEQLTTENESLKAELARLQARLSGES